MHDAYSRHSSDAIAFLFSHIGRFAKKLELGLTSRDASVLVDWRLETAEGTYNTANMNLQVG